MSAAAIPLPVIPELENGTGVPLGAEAARLAIANNADELDDDNIELPPSPDGDAEPGPTAESGETETPGAGGSRPPRPESAKSRLKKLRRMKRDELATLYLELLERHEVLEGKYEQLTREYVVRTAVGNEVIDESVTDLVGDLVDLADAGGQFMALPDRAAAKAVALEPDEREHLVNLGARVAKMQGAAYLDKSPIAALVVGVLSVSLGKYIAYKTAKFEQLEPLRPGIDAPRETVAAATPAPATQTEPAAPVDILPAEVGMPLEKRRRHG